MKRGLYLIKIQAPIGACMMRPGETRQSDTRQKHGHRFNFNLPKKLRFKSMKGSKSCSRILVFDEKSKGLPSLIPPAKILRFN